MQKYIDTLPFHLQPARLYDVKWDDFEDSKFFSQYNDKLLEKLGSAKFKGFTFAQENSLLYHPTDILHFAIKCTKFGAVLLQLCAE